MNDCGTCKHIDLHLDDDEPCKSCSIDCDKFDWNGVEDVNAPLTYGGVAV